MSNFPPLNIHFLCIYQEHRIGGTSGGLGRTLLKKLRKWMITGSRCWRNVSFFVSLVHLGEFLEHTMCWLEYLRRHNMNTLRFNHQAHSALITFTGLYMYLLVVATLEFILPEMCAYCSAANGQQLLKYGEGTDWPTLRLVHRVFTNFKQSYCN